MSASEIEYPQSYKPDEIQQILQLAIARQGQKEELSREQLWEIAAELEIEAELLQKAEQDWLNQKQLSVKKQEFNLYRREQLKHSLIRYLIVNSFLVTINLISLGTLSWSLYILLIWGIAISLKTWKTIQVKGESYEQEFQSWYFRQQMKNYMGNFWLWLQKTWLMRV